MVSKPEYTARKKLRPAVTPTWVARWSTLHQRIQDALQELGFRTIGKHAPLCACGVVPPEIALGRRCGTTHYFLVVRTSPEAPPAIAILKGVAGSWALEIPWKEAELVPEEDPLGTLLREIRLLEDPTATLSNT